MIIKKISLSPKQTIEFAKKIGSKLHKGDIIAYKGGLGAGKTTFTRGIVMGLGMEDDVTSPTFALVNEYSGGNILVYHFDMYRITNEDALESTGFYDYPLDQSVFIIEWAENILELLPQNIISITINYINDNSREIIIEGDERFADIGN